MEKTVAFCTLGCKVNQYETNEMIEQFIKKGYEIKEFNEKADIYIIKTNAKKSKGNKSKSFGCSLRVLCTSCKK